MLYFYVINYSLDGERFNYRFHAKSDADALAHFAAMVPRATIRQIITERRTENHQVP